MCRIHIFRQGICSQEGHWVSCHRHAAHSPRSARPPLVERGGCPTNDSCAIDSRLESSSAGQPCHWHPRLSKASATLHPRARSVESLLEHLCRPPTCTAALRTQVAMLRHTCVFFGPPSSPEAPFQRSRRSHESAFVLTHWQRMSLQPIANCHLRSVHVLKNLSGAANPLQLQIINNPNQAYSRVFRAHHYMQRGHEQR
eukprot:1898456-Amphidinium_carterae.2